MNAIMDLFSLNGKNAVVTGANTGLGQGIAAHAVCLLEEA